MNFSFSVFIFVCLLSIKASLSVEDLLDQYVRHIDETNTISTIRTDKIVKDSRFRHKVNKRSVKTNDDSAISSPSLANRTKRKAASADSNQWTHSEYLDTNNTILLKWQPRHQEILFRVEAKTRGYIGIGFSPNGGMEGADIILGWIDDSTSVAHLLDCHGGTRNEGSAPIRDEIDNYRLMAGIQNDTHTIIEFRRALDTCDPDDYILGPNTVRVIWAIHDKDPHPGAEMVYHRERRGSQSLHLLGPPPIPKPDNSYNLRQWDVTFKQFEVKDDTTYWCKIFKAPALQTKHHITGYEPIIGSNHTSLIHHMLLHECEMSYKEIKKWEQFSKEDGHPCYSPEMPIEWEKCLTPIATWAVGSKGENIPKHVGLPLSSPTYFMLEVHFDNPSMKRAIDTSGLRLHYTHKLRPNEGGFLVAGVTISPLQIIPPQQTEYKSGGYCSMDCTREVLPKEGINVISVLLHSHLAGRKLKLRHIRGDKELVPIAQDDHYDYNYQQSRTLSHEVNILPGDGLVTECIYSTKTRKKPTLGGYSTREEMCLAFILHYPKTKLAGCYSMPPIKYFFDNLGVKEFYEHNMTEVENMFLHGMPEPTVPPEVASTSIFPPYKPGDENSDEANQKAILALQNAKAFTEGDTNAGLGPLDRLIIKEPLEFQNKSFMSHLQSLPYDETLLTKRIEEYFYSGLHLTFCRKRDDTLALTEKIERFPNFTAYTNNAPQLQCSYRQRIQSSGSSQIYPVINIFTILAVLLSNF